MSTIRPARAADAEAVTAVEAESLGDDAWSGALVAAVVAGTVPTVQARVAVADDDEVVGWVAVSAVAEVSELQRLAVAPSGRRRGLATALVAAAVEVARAQGAERLLLEVREGNTAARGLYDRVGFATAGLRPRYYRDGADAVVLELTLPPPAGPGR